MLHPKSKQQQKRLAANVRQAKANRKDARKPQKNPNARKSPPVYGTPKKTFGFFGKGRATKRSGYPSKDGCSGVEFVRTLR